MNKLKDSSSASSARSTTIDDDDEEDDEDEDDETIEWLESIDRGDEGTIEQSKTRISSRLIRATSRSTVDETASSPFPVTVPWQAD